MKRRLIHGFFTAYVLFAVFTAYSAVAENQIPVVYGPHQETKVGAPEQIVRHSKRLDVPDTQNNRADNQKRYYKIRVWTAEWCAPCKRYKREEIPALLKFGYQVEVLDYDEDDPPETVKSVPTVMLYYKGDLVISRTYWRANDVNQFIENRLSLKEGQLWRPKHP